MLQTLSEMDQDDIYVQRRMRWIERLAAQLEDDAKMWEAQHG